MGNLTRKNYHECCAELLNLQPSLTTNSPAMATMPPET